MPISRSSIHTLEHSSSFSFILTMKTTKTLSRAVFVVVALLAVSSTHAAAQGWLDKAKKTLKDVGGSAVKGFSEDDAAKALKEALVQGTSKGSAALGATNGYFGNPAVKIPFPKDAQKVESTLRKVGLGQKVDDAVLAINRFSFRLLKR
jgi:hypothetical protein